MEQLSKLIAIILEANNIDVPSIDDDICGGDSDCDYNCDWDFKEGITN